MKYKIVITKAADRDFIKDFLWYAKENSDLAKRFRESIKKEIKFLSDAPFACALISKEARQVISHKFPYRIIFIIEDNNVVIIAILHVKRSPSIWKKRITNH
ncbi:MAG: type II toxin-antitoxin system RelE/ParE family toxin [Pseudomonadota bacterium]